MSGDAGGLRAEVPSSVLEKSFALLPFTDQVELQWACKQFQSAMPFRSVDLGHLWSRQTEPIRRLSYEERLKFSCSLQPCHKCVYLKWFPSPVHGNVSFFRSAVACNLIASSFGNLRHLKLRHMRFDVQQMGRLQALMTLEIDFLGSDGGSLSDDCIRVLGNLESLEIRFPYYGGHAGTGSTFDFLSNAFSITRLIINCRSLTLADLRKLPDTVRLTELDVSMSEAACDGLIDFLIERRFPIVTLRLDRYIRVWHNEDRLSASAIRDYLSWTSTLKHLSLRRNRGITADIFNADEGYLQTLERLDIVGTQCGETLDAVFELRQKRDDLLATGLSLPNVTVIVNPYNVNEVITDFTPVSGNGLNVVIEEDYLYFEDDNNEAESESD